MKSVDVIQEVQVLSRVMASHQPSSETRWQEETNVRSRVEQVRQALYRASKRGLVVVQDARSPTGKGINAGGTPVPDRCELRTVSMCWNATSVAATKASCSGGHRGRRPEHADKGMARELARASSSPVVRNTRISSGEIPRGSPPRHQSSHRKGPHRRVDSRGKRGGWPVRRNEPECEGASDGR
jgi:hypothetical protein